MNIGYLRLWYVVQVQSTSYPENRQLNIILCRLIVTRTQGSEPLCFASNPASFRLVILSHMTRLMLYTPCSSVFTSLSYCFTACTLFLHYRLNVGCNSCEIVFDRTRDPSLIELFSATCWTNCNCRYSVQCQRINLSFVEPLLLLQQKLCQTSFVQPSFNYTQRCKAFQSFSIHNSAIMRDASCRPSQVAFAQKSAVPNAN